jgi:2'-5' RNA ligase
MRLFYAVLLHDISPDLTKAQAQLHRLPVQLVPAQNLHITLRFVGEVPETQIEEYVDLGGRVRQQAFSVLVSGRLYGLPAVERWTALGLEVIETDGALGGLARQLQHVERRPFLPHITLARAREPQHGLPNIQMNPLRTGITRFHLMESRLTAKGAEYRSLCHFSLH